MAKTAKNERLTRASVYNINVKADPYECPFREFRDSELSQEYWGLSPQGLRMAIMRGPASKSTVDQLWFDEQTQPLPQSVRKHLYEWKRAEEVASAKFDCEVVLFEDSDGAKMSVVEVQLSHPTVLKRSSFVRKVLSTCYMLEQNENLVTEHQWDNFTCSFPDGWRPKFHVYSPTMKPGGGFQHRATLSKNGCYLVRLYYLGAWRCVWVNDQVPVSLIGVPLLPFAPLVTPTKTGPVGKSLGSNVTSSTIHLWPLLLCKALLKLAAPDISASSFDDEDEKMLDFSIIHSLTGCMRIKYKYNDPDVFWNQLYTKVQIFVWDEDEETTVSVAKRSVKNKPIAKDVPVCTSMVSFRIIDTAEYPPFKLPGITPAFEMDLIITMCRDLPLKKPLPEPEVPLWKTFRWVDWARRHGLYELYECPRTRFLKVNGLLKLSHAPHLLDVGSTESITQAFRMEHEQAHAKKERKGLDDKSKEKAVDLTTAQYLQMKEQLREWVLFDSIIDIVKEIFVSFYPAQYQFTTCTSNLVIKVQKVPNKALDILGSKTSPLYLQLDSPNENQLRVSLSALHPRILLNSNVPIEYYVEPSYLLVEEFDWFEEPSLVRTKAFTETRGYNSFEMTFPPGRHVCRLWVHSHVHWHVAVLSKSTMLLGTRDVILCAAARECPWSTAFLSNLGIAFTNWCKINRNNPQIMNLDRDFFKAYQPDLKWDAIEIGYNIKLLHWMFRQALQSMLYSSMNQLEFNCVIGMLRGMFRDPEFGIFKNEKPVRFSLQEIKEFVGEDPCVCPTPEESDINLSTQLDETKTDRTESDKSRLESARSEVVLTITNTMMERLMTPMETAGTSNVCDVAIDDKISCSYLREERRKEIIRHEAATTIQAYWRGAYARKIIKKPQPITADALKILNERLYGRIESLSTLMNIFFQMFPTTKSAYSVSSALNGLTGLRQYSGNTHVTPKCRWIPYFQGLFYCHSPVKVHFDILSIIPYNTFSIFNNDTEKQLPACYQTHFTYKISPNVHGYTVIGHGTQLEETGFPQDISWQLTVLASMDKVFHVCDNDEVMCKELPTLTPLNKLHVEEVFLPNRRNILGSVQILVISHEFINFKVVASSPDLEMIAVLRHITLDGSEEVVISCAGRGEIFWPYIHVEGRSKFGGKKSISWGMLQEDKTLNRKLSIHSSKALLTKTAKLKATASKSTKTNKGGKEASTDTPNEYRLEVIAPYGWPLLLDQWKRIDEIRNVEFATPPLTETAKKSPKEKQVYLKDKKEEKLGALIQQVKPQDGDAFIVLECSYPENGMIVALRDDSRDIEFSNAFKSWDIDDPSRNARGAEIRQLFRNEYLEKVTHKTLNEEMISVDEDDSFTRQAGPSLASEMLLEEESVVSADSLTLIIPETLKDKFKPLDYVPLCTKIKEDKPGLLFTSAMADVEKLDRHESIAIAMVRMRELQVYNEVHQLERQKKRFQRIETLHIDGGWNPGLVQVYEAQEEAIAAETLARSLSATKKAKTQNTSTNASVAGKRARGGKKK